jgi:hypothetical protein
VPESDPDRLSEQLEQEADALQRRSEELHEKVEDVRQDWERKRADPGVPGAPPPADGEGGETEPDQSGDA